LTPVVAVIGNGDDDAERDHLAEEAGAAIARAGYGLVCGGLGGVMAAACRGARSVTRGDGPPIIAILPGTDKSAANPDADVVLPTGLGYARNSVVVLAADAVVAIGGKTGTLSEIAHAWQLGKPLCAYGGAAGWATRLGGETLDDKRTDRIGEAHSEADLERWLQETLAQP